MLISLHLPLTPESHHLLDGGHLADDAPVSERVVV